MNTLELSKIKKYLKYSLVIICLFGGLSYLLKICHDQLSKVEFFVEDIPTYDRQNSTLIVKVAALDGWGQGASTGEQLLHVFCSYEVYKRESSNLINIRLYGCRSSNIDAKLITANEDGKISVVIPVSKDLVGDLVEITINGDVISTIYIPD